MTTPTVTETRRNANPVSERVELARYSLLDGTERVLYGQRVLGVVRFLPDQPVVLDAPSAGSEDCSCSPRDQRRHEQRSDATRQKRPNDLDGAAATRSVPVERRGRTGARVELARYVVSAGERAEYGQRILGVVRVTDVPLAPGGRAYLVERGLEEEGANANAALQALIADYVRQASIFDEVPMAAIPF
jgi:hypothetical protein